PDVLHARPRDHGSDGSRLDPDGVAMVLLDDDRIDVDSHGAGRDDDALERGAGDGVVTLHRRELHLMRATGQVGADPEVALDSRGGGAAAVVGRDVAGSVEIDAVRPEADVLAAANGRVLDVDVVAAGLDADASTSDLDLRVRNGVVDQGRVDQHAVRHRQQAASLGAEAPEGGDGESRVAAQVLDAVFELLDA